MRVRAFVRFRTKAGSGAARIALFDARDHALASCDTSD
jgi:hypothetical protein